MIVTGYDGSEASRAALVWAAREACRRDSQLRILHAINVPALVPGTGRSSIAAEPLEDAGEQLLAEGEELARGIGVGSVTTRLCHATPASALVAESRSAEVVVVGSRGHGQLRAGLLGSVAYAVTAHASSHVVVVRPGHDAVVDASHPVVVGADGSEHAARAVDAAAEVAERAGASLHIVGAWQVPTSQGQFSAGFWGPPDSVGVDTTLEEAARAGIEQIRARTAARHPQLEVTAEVVEGAAAALVCQAGEHAGLLVVGSRGRAGFAGLLLGSVSHRVLHDAAVPVMVVR